MDQAQIDNLNAEKIALDQMLMSAIKEVHEYKKQIVLLNSNLKNILDTVEKKNKEIEEMKKNIQENYRPKLDCESDNSIEMVIE